MVMLTPLKEMQKNAVLSETATSNIRNQITISFRKCLQSPDHSLNSNCKNLTNYHNYLVNYSAQHFIYLPFQKAIHNTLNSFFIRMYDKTMKVYYKSLSDKVGK